MLTHRRSPEPAAPPRREAEEKEDDPSATSLHSAIARANAVDLPGDSRMILTGAPSESSLPRALARANDSRHPESASAVPTAEAEAPQPLRPTLTDLFFHFERWSDAARPTSGWWINLPVLLSSAALWVHHPRQAFLPTHPTPGTNIATPDLFPVHAGQDFFWGGLALLALSLLAQTIYRTLGKGAPPLFWTIKITGYAFLPLTLLQLFRLTLALDEGPEIYFRGYRSDMDLFWTPILLIIAGVWGALRLTQAASSRHCQANPQTALPGFLLMPVLLFTTAWGTPRLRTQLSAACFDRKQEALSAFATAAPNAASLWEQFANCAANLSFSTRRDLYLFRGESRWKAGDLSGAREDFLRLYRMMPPSEPLAVFGAAATRMMVGQAQSGHRDLLHLLHHDTPPSVFLRWDLYTALGRFDEDLTDLPRAEERAQTLWIREALPLHGELLAEALLRQEKHRPLLRFLQEAESITTPTPLTFLQGAVAAEALGREMEARRWQREALRREPRLAAHFLHQRLTSLP